MKRLFIILMAVVIATLAFGAGAVFADNGPHGNYTSTTDACAGCHRAHTAQAANLLIAEGTELCLSCHGTAGTGANTNVEDGMWTGSGGGSLRGGGFENVTMDTAANNVADAAALPVTSAHLVEGMAGYTDGTIWGHGATDSGAGQTGYVLECTSCHAQHGKGGVAVDGTTKVASYRLLKATPGNSGDGLTIDDTVITPYSATVTDTTTYNYVISDTTHNAYFGEPYYSDEGSGVLRGAALPISYFCVRCHDRVYARSSTSAPMTDSGDDIYAYRHTSVGLPSSGVPRSRQCVTCHVAHGTSAEMTGFAAEVPEPGSTTTMQDSALLRVDNRTTCLECHANSIGAPVPPAY